MPLEQVKLYIQNAKSIYESYDYLWSMIEDSDRINRVEYDPDDGTGDCFVAIPKLQEGQIRIYQVTRGKRKGRPHEHTTASNAVYERQIFGRNERGQNYIWRSE